MTTAGNRMALVQVMGPREGLGLAAKNAALVVLGVGLMICAAKVRVPMWPVSMTMQTFAVLTLGAAYGARLGLVTLLTYIALGAAGVTVFTGDSAGLAYIAGPTGGYVVGFAAAAALVGALAERGWSRSVTGMIGALVLGNLAIYAVGLPWMAWLFGAEKGAAWVFQWGIGNFLVGDALKLALAAMLLPAAWTLTGRR